MLRVHNRSGERVPADYSESLRLAVGDERVDNDVARPVLTDLSGDMDEVQVPREYRDDSPYLLKLVIKEFEFERDGDADIEIACRVYDPRDGEFLMKKAFAFDPGGKDYSDRDALLERSRDQVAREVARYLEVKIR